MTDSKLEKVNKLYEAVAQSVSQGNFPHGVLVECENEQDCRAYADRIAETMAKNGHCI